MKLLIFIIPILVCAHASAEISHDLIRRIVVFPVSASSAYQAEAQEAWWRIRETLTEGKQFLVASKDFLERKDVFQARSQLSNADVIILSELLDAQMIVTGELKNKKLTLYAYEGERGQLLWTKTSSMHLSLPIKDQIEKTSKEITHSLIAAIPYHGFVEKDEIIGQTVYQREGKILVNISYSTKTNISKGDDIQLVKLHSQSLKPLFQGGAILEVFAEGKILSLSSGQAVVEIKRATNLDDIAQASLVRFPRELKRIKELYALKDSISRRINPDYFSPEMSDVQRETQETKPLVTALSFLANAATILLLAF